MSMKRNFFVGILIMLMITGCNSVTTNIQVNQSQEVDSSEEASEFVDDESSGEPETSEPETSEPETSEPETSEPETSEPETSEPETSEPETESSTPNVSGNKVNFQGFVISDAIRNLPSQNISLGYSQESAARDEYNRPTYIEGIHQKYGDKYNSIYIGDENSKTIYLTFTMGYEYFNDGVANTDVIMDILKEKNVPAMFFVDGGYIKYRSDICKRIVENGFVLGCHGYDHPSTGVATLPIEEQLEDAKKIYNALYEITGVEPYYYRFGSGIWNERALALLSELGFRNIFYSFTYKDYDVNNQPDEAESLQRMIDNLHNGEIMYLHTVSNTNVAILDDFIDAARERGYEFGLLQ